MKISDLDREEYKDITLYKMEEYNNHLPVYIRKVTPKMGLSPLHRHEAVQINYINRGRLWHSINNSRFELVKGDVFIIPPYIPHQLLCDDDSDYEIMELEFVPEFIFGNTSQPFTEGNNTSVFDFSYIEPFLVSECNVRPRLNLTGEKQLIVEALLNELYDEYTIRRDSYLLALKADLLKLLVLLGRYFREETESSDAIQLFNHHRDAMMQAIDYVDQHYTEPIFIEDVARLAMLSQSYFSYLFKAITHKTFVEYLNSLRIQKAMDLLKVTNDLVVDVCFESGFKNVNHFNRTFKSMVGVSPMQYRKSNRKKKEDVAENREDRQKTSAV